MDPRADWRFSDGRWVEKVGYSPDVRVTAGGDALTVALDRLSNGF